MSNDLIILEGIIEDIKNETAPEMKQDLYFEILLSEQITKDYDLSYEQIQDGLIGGNLDGGIDSFYIFVNGMLVESGVSLPPIKDDVRIHIIIIQAKNQRGYSEEVINKLVAVSEDIFNFERDINEFEGVYSEDLLDLVAQFRQLYKSYASRFPHLQFSYFYGSKAVEPPTENIKRKANLLKAKIESLFSSSECAVTFLGASDLLALIRRKTKSSFELKLAENAISSSEGTSFVGLVKLHDYFDFITDDDGKLIHHIFEANVRDWQGGSNSINSQILDTLKNPSKKDFWWLNNGITIVSTAANIRGGKTMTIENPEIVNGLQTSREIFDYFSSEASGKTDVRNILVRIIVPEEAESRDSIILATNSQTAIPIESLKSTQKIHRDIEAHLIKHGMYYDRRRNHWKLQRKPMSQIVTIKKMAQAVLAAALHKTDIAKGRPSEIFRKNNDLYDQVFTESYPIELYSVCAKLLIRIENLLKTGLIETELNQRALAQINLHVLTHAMIHATRIPVPVPYEIAKFTDTSVSDDLLIDSIQRVLELFVKMGPNNITSKSSEFANDVINDAKSLISKRK